MLMVISFYTFAEHTFCGDKNNFGLVVTSAYDAKFGHFAYAQHINS